MHWLRSYFLAVISIVAFTILCPTFGAYAQGDAASYDNLYGVRRGVASNGWHSYLVSFRSDTPHQLALDIPITGLQSGEAMIALDFRPQTGELYGLSDDARLFRINTTNAAATLVATLDIGNPYDADIDFDPVDGDLRIIVDGISNYRADPATGVVTPAASLVFAPGDAHGGETRYMGGVAYPPAPQGATTTTLYAVGARILATIGSPSGAPVSPDSGQMYTVAQIGGIMDWRPDFRSGIGNFDIAPDTGTAYISASRRSLNYYGFPDIYTLDLINGAATYRGTLPCYSSGLTRGDTCALLLALAVAPSTPLPEALRIAPIADTYVQGATTSRDTNYGATAEMQVKRTLNPGSGRGRRGFLKFDMSNVVGAVRSARLRVFARLTDPSLPQTRMIVQKVTDTAWDEMTMTWNNQPDVASPDALAQITVAGAAGQYYEFDLTAFLQQERAAGRSIVSFRLINQTATGNTGASYTSVSTKEAIENKPLLVIQQ